MTAGGWTDRGEATCSTGTHKPGTVTVPAGGKTGDEVPTGTFNSILKQAGLK
jgi:predicted RNA binding protein YcfA (HicA-like mRNA interferase family)